MICYFDVKLCTIILIFILRMYSEMNNNEIALPLDYQQIIQAINIEPYLNYVDNIFKTPLGYVVILLKI